MLIFYTDPDPLILIFVDFSKAFDSTWKEGLFHKLLLKGAPPRLVASIKALYSTLSTRVKGASGDAIACNTGFAQGSTNSLFFFTTFINDLYDIFLDLDAGFTLFDLAMVIFLFSDDLVIPVRSLSMVPRVLRTLESYASTWKLSYNLSKSSVLPFRLPPTSVPAPTSWPFMDGVIKLSHTEKFLTNTFSSFATWDEHIADRLDKATKAFYVLIRAGLLGGDVLGGRSAFIASTMLWPSSTPAGYAWICSSRQCPPRSAPSG